MSRLPARFNFGSEIRNLNNQLYNQLTDVYGKLTDAINRKANTYETTADPANSAEINANFDIGDFWVNTKDQKIWVVITRTTAEDVTWRQITLV